MKLFRKSFNLLQGAINSLQTRLFKSIIADYGDIHLFGRVHVVNPGNIHIGDGCTINHDCYLNAHNPIRIGNDVTLSAKVSLISTGIDVTNWLEGTKCHVQNNGIEIGDHIWIGAGAMILSNVHIRGPYVVVAAGAVVTKDINEPYCVVGGCPAKIIKYLK